MRCHTVCLAMLTLRLAPQPEAARLAYELRAFHRMLNKRQASRTTDRHVQCQYYAVPYMRPPGSTWRASVRINNVLGVGDCERACTEDASCKGYVARSPWNKVGTKRQGQCWKVFEKHDLREMNPGGGDKTTYFKGNCDCAARTIRVFRDEQARYDLAMATTKVAALENEIASLKQQPQEQQQHKSNESPSGSLFSNITGMLHDSQDLPYKLRTKESELKAWVIAKESARKDVDTANALEQFDGVYEYKGLEGLIPPYLSSMAPMLGMGGAKLVRMIRAIRKFTGRSTGGLPVHIHDVHFTESIDRILYRCGAYPSNATQWYVSTIDQLKMWAAERLGVSKMDGVNNLDDLLANSKKLGLLATSQLIYSAFALYTSATCVGVPIEQEADGTYKICSNRPGGNKNGDACRKVDGNFLPTVDEPEKGCFPSAVLAKQAHARSVVEAGHVSCESMVNKLEADRFQKVLATLQQSDAASRLAFFLNGKFKWYWKALAKTEGGKQIANMDWKSYNTLLQRALKLMSEFEKVSTAWQTIILHEDPHIKIVCGDKMLNALYSMGGIFPKVAQNLAVQPQLVKDPYIMEILKETQSDNPTRPKEELESYLQDLDTRVKLTTGVELPLLDVLETDKALAAGTIGQVNLFRVKPKYRDSLWESDHDQAVRDTVIVKTVFKETEVKFMNDFLLLEVIFGESGQLLPEAVRSLWTMIAPMREPIMDEFDLFKERAYGLRGQQIMKEFASREDTKKRLPGLTLAVPNARSTTTKYVMIQSTAKGQVLKDYMQKITGMPEKIARWRSRIFPAMLHSIGYQMVKHNFFMADPHAGNWFWDDESSTLTLLDWGGVGILDNQTGCAVSNVVATLGQLDADLSSCDSVQLRQTKKTPEGIDVTGRYDTAFVSFQAADETTPEENTLYGMAFSPLYANTQIEDENKKGLNLKVDPESKDPLYAVIQIEDEMKKDLRLKIDPNTKAWVIENVSIGNPELYKRLFTLEPKNRNKQKSADLEPGEYRLRGDGFQNSKVEVTRHECKYTPEERSSLFAQATANMNFSLWFYCKEYAYFAPLDRLLCIQTRGTGALFTQFVDAAGVQHEYAITKDSSGRKHITYQNKSEEIGGVTTPNMSEEQKSQLVSISEFKRALRPPRNMLDSDPLKAIDFDSFDEYIQFRLLQALKSYFVLIASFLTFDMKTLLTGMKQALEIFEYFSMLEFPLGLLQVVRFLISFSGILMDVGKANFPPRLPVAYFEWMMDSRDITPKIWGAYAVDTALSRKCDAVRPQWDKIANLSHVQKG